MVSTFEGRGHRGSLENNRTLHGAKTHVKPSVVSSEVVLDGCSFGCLVTCRVFWAPTWGLGLGVWGLGS